MATRKNLIANGAEITPLTREELILAGKEVTPLNEKERTMTAAVSGGGGGGYKFTLATMKFTNNSGGAVNICVPYYEDGGSTSFSAGFYQVANSAETEIPVILYGGMSLVRFPPAATYPDYTLSGDISWNAQAQAFEVTGDCEIIFTSGQ